MPASIQMSFSLFQSTPPARGATKNRGRESDVLTFQSTPPARGATTWNSTTRRCVVISIHAPREGGDQKHCRARASRHYFNPRPPRGGRLMICNDGDGYYQFQSTPPARGATSRFCRICKRKQNFNPRPPRGGRQVELTDVATKEIISIHAPREGGDPGPKDRVPWLDISIHAPREGGDNEAKPGRGITAISIHAPREGGDPPAPGHHLLCRNFNPRPPRGGRRGCACSRPRWTEFQSTPPARGATKGVF